MTVNAFALRLSQAPPEPAPNHLPLPGCVLGDGASGGNNVCLALRRWEGR